MDTKTINLVIKYSFRICYMYLMKYLLIAIPEYIRVYARIEPTLSYDAQIESQVRIMKDLLCSSHNICNISNVGNNVNENIGENVGGSNDDPSDEKTNEQNQVSPAKNNDNNIPYDEIRKSITDQLKQKYGDNVCIDFTYETCEEDIASEKQSSNVNDNVNDNANDNMNDNVVNKKKLNNFKLNDIVKRPEKTKTTNCMNNINDSLYSLKIKGIGRTDPDIHSFSESDIYVNTKAKTFSVMCGKGFKTFPLPKKSVIKYDKN